MDGGFQLPLVFDMPLLALYANAVLHVAITFSFGLAPMVLHANVSDSHVLSLSFFMMVPFITVSSVLFSLSKNVKFFTTISSSTVMVCHLGGVVKISKR